MRYLSSCAAVFAVALAASIQVTAIADQAAPPAQANPEQAAPKQPEPKQPAPAETTSTQAAPAPTEATAAPAAATPAPPTPAPVLPDASLTNTIALVRKSVVGGEPHVGNYLDRMAAGKATAAQVNDFAAYVSKRGMPRVALSFQQYALRLEPQNATLWLNLGTIQRTIREYGDAVSSYKKAITFDPINALAHYNLGAVYDAQGHYDDAIEEYRRALVLDPNLADPRKNPQVVNNENMLAVELELYRAQSGSLGLPLLQTQKSAATPKAEGNKP